MKNYNDKLTKELFLQLLPEYEPISAALSSASKHEAFFKIRKAGRTQEEFSRVVAKFEDRWLELEKNKTYKAMGNDSKIVLMRNPSAYPNATRDELIVDRISIEQARGQLKDNAVTVENLDFNEAFNV